MGRNKRFHRLMISIVMLASLGWSAALTELSLAKTTASIMYVKMGESSDCSSWALACDLQTALGTAASGDEIWVQAGIYKPTTNPNDQQATFQLKSGVALYGGFGGSETDREQRDWASHITVMSGDIGEDDLTDPDGVVTDAADIAGGNSYNVVNGSGVDASAVLDGFTITAGDSIMYGGGMTNWAGGSPTLANLIFSGNRAGDVGGGMFNFMGSNPSLTDVTFAGNTAASGGGGLYNHESNPTLSRVTFSNNRAVNGAAMVNYTNSSPHLNDVAFSGNAAENKAGGMENNSNSNPILVNVTFSGNSARYGSGMHNYQSSPSLTEVTFSDNTAGHVGGGMENEESSPTLTDVTFSGNTAVGGGGGMFNTDGSQPTLTNVTFSDNSAGVGGGMANWLSSPILTDVIFLDNSSLQAGGGMENNTSSNPTLTNVTFSGNTTDGGGGGMFNMSSSNPILTNVTFHGNTAANGGGMENNSRSRPTLTNVTFSGNRAVEGGGILNVTATFTLTNAVVWGNIPAENQISGDPATVTYSDIEGGYPGIGNINADPHFDVVAGKDGSTILQALLTGSPAIDAGEPVSCPATDQRGLSRPADGDGDGQAICDMGSFEYGALAFTQVEPAREELVKEELARVEMVNKTDQTVSISLSGDKASYVLIVEAGATKIFTVERDIYRRATQACGNSDTGTVDVTKQVRLVFTPCWSPAPNQGEPSMEKIHIPDSPEGMHWYYR